MVSNNEEIILDLDDEFENRVFILLNLKDIENFYTRSVYKVYIKPYLEENQKSKFKLFIKTDIAFNEISNLENRIKKGLYDDIKLVKTQKFLNFLNEENQHLEIRKKISINIKNKDKTIIKDFEKYKIILNNQMFRVLREKQIWDSFFMYTMQKSCNFSVPGSGKTSSVLGVFSFLLKEGKIKKLLVIGPKNSFETWKNEFIICFKERINLNCFDIDEMSKKYEKNDISKLLKEKNNLLLFNYEILEKYKEDLLSLVKENDILIVFDEIHRIKRIDGIYSKVPILLSKYAKYIIGLTGTPIPNSYMDLFNTLKIIFGRNYYLYFGFTPNDLKNPSEKIKSEINNKVFPFFCRTTKKELNVPNPNQDLIIKVVTTEDEKKLFKIVYSKCRKNPFELFVRILQIESNPKLLLKSVDDEIFKEVFDDWDGSNDFKILDKSAEITECINKIKFSSKKLACINLIKNLVKENKKIILWCIFIDSIKSFQEIFRKEKISSDVIYGITESNERKKIINKFKNGDFNVLITNPHTLAESVSLHDICHDAIYFEYSYNLVHFLQSKDRIHRLGLKNDSYTQWYFIQTIFNMNFGKFSLDGKIYNRLLEKEKIMLDAIENNYLESMTTGDEDLNLIFQDLRNLF